MHGEKTASPGRVRVHKLNNFLRRLALTPRIVLSRSRYARGAGDVGAFAPTSDLSETNNMICRVIGCLAALCFVLSSPVTSTISQQTTNDDLIRDFISSDWQKVSAAKAVLESRQAKAIPLLVQLLERDEKAELHNTADLISTAVHTGNYRIGSSREEQDQEFCIFLHSLTLNPSGFHLFRPQICHRDCGY
jgi:hypothetical protein